MRFVLSYYTKQYVKSFYYLTINLKTENKGNVFFQFTLKDYYFLLSGLSYGYETKTFTSN